MKGMGRKFTYDPVENQLRCDHYHDHRTCPACGFDHIHINITQTGNDMKFRHLYGIDKQMYKYKCTKCFTAWHSNRFLNKHTFHF